MIEPRFIINGMIRVHPRDVSAFMRATALCVEATRREPGCAYYAVGQDLIEPEVFHMQEGWATEAAFEAHMRSPHLAAALAVIEDLTIEDARIHRYETAGRTELSLPSPGPGVENDASVLR
jgi:quinol monooxygenase YgiN